MSNEEIVDISSKKLEKKWECPNSDWRCAYRRYQSSIGENKIIHEEASKVLKKLLPTDMGLIRIYSSITLAQKKPVVFDLRVLGQSVATLKVDNQKLFLKISQEHSLHNKRYFEIKTPEGIYEWNSDESKNIFDSLRRIAPKATQVHSPEHTLETLILSEMSKTGNKKILRYIRPVTIGGKGFFQMRTPFSASNHNIKDYPKYSMHSNGAAWGGGIDILARIVHRDGSNRLAVIELKDENKKKEPQPLVMHQALVYATFVAHLLRDEKCGNFWWNIFRGQKDEKYLDKNNKLKIDVVTMMPPIPSNEEGKRLYTEGDLKPIDVPGVNVTLYPSTIYIEADLDKFKIKDVFGTLIDDKKK